MQRAAAIPRNTKVNYHDHVGAGRQANARFLMTFSDSISADPLVQIAQIMVVLRGSGRVYWYR